MNIKKLLGKRIKELRLKNDLTQEALAEKINISAKSLSQIELGNNFVSADTLENLCSAFDATPKILFDFNEYSRMNEDVLPFIIKKLNENHRLLFIVDKLINVFEHI